MLLALLCLLVYLFISLFYIRRSSGTFSPLYQHSSVETHQDFFLVPTGGGRDNQPLPPRGINQSFDAVNPEAQYLVRPHDRSATASPQLMEETIGVPYDHHPPLSQNESLPPSSSHMHEVDYRTLDPFADPPPHLRPRSQESSQYSREPQMSPEARTIQSQGSILETPVNVFTTDNLYSYRISPETAEVFDLHARRMEEELGRTNDRLGVTPRLSTRRSSTDLKRMRVVK